MPAESSDPLDLRRQAARLTCALLRFDRPAAHLLGSSTPPGHPVVGVDAYTFLPSWKSVRNEDVEQFLLDLDGPALLAPTTIRGTIALFLLDELAGDRKKWGQKTLSNFAVSLDETTKRLGLTTTTRVLVEFDGEEHVFSLAAVREWSQSFPVQVGWGIGQLKDDARADVQMKLRRSDGEWHPKLRFVPGSEPPPGDSIRGAT